MIKPLYIYVDVDETFVRNYSTKRIPMPPVIEHIKKLKEAGAIMYCWSSGGAKYAEESAKEFGIGDCFIGFLPKPEILIDDLKLPQWQNLLQIHPNECPQHTLESYKENLKENNK